MRDEMEAFLLPTFPYLAFFRADTFFLLPGEGHPKVTGTHSTVEIGTPTKTNLDGAECGVVALSCLFPGLS